MSPASSSPKQHTFRLALATGVAALIGVSAIGGPALAAEGTVTIWDSGLLASSSDGIIDRSRSFIYEAANVCEAETGVKLEITQTSGDFTAASNQFRAASIARNGPDLKTTFAGGQVLSFEQFLAPLNDVFDQETIDSLTGWDTVRSNYDPDGNILALPYGAGSYFYVFYRPSLFEQAGVAFSEPSTWEEMLDLAQKVKDGGVNPFWVANQQGYVGAWAIALLGGGEIGTDVYYRQVSGDLPINSEGMKRAYEAYAELFSRGLTNPDAGSVQHAQAAEGFIQGRGAMLIGGAWWNEEFLSSLGDDVAWFPIPTLSTAVAPGIVGGGPNIAIMMTNYAQNPDGAREILRCLARPELIDLYVKIHQTEPSNHRNADPSVITNRLLREQAERLITQDVVYPFDNLMPVPVIDHFYRVNASVFTGQLSAGDAVDQLQAEFERQQIEE